MRILRAHNRYQERGGEDVVFESEVDLLRAYGEEVETLIATNDDIPAERSIITSARLAASTLWSRDGERRVLEAIDRFKPDIVHFDNTFPLLSPAAYSACRKRGVPVVQTLHNFRLLCPNVLFYRDNSPCEDCLGKVFPWPGVQHGCYRDSRGQTAVVASMVTAHRVRQTWNRDVDIYIALSEFSRGKFIEGGLPPEKIVVKPNFVASFPAPPDTTRSGFVSVGRLSREKGVMTILRAWDRDPAPGVLKMVGDGPLQEDVHDVARRRPDLQALGRLPKEQVLEQMQGAIAMVFPSECYENFPVSIAEAFASGLPVIASNHGAMSELVKPGRTGLHFTPGDADDLFNKVRWAAENPDAMRRMGLAAREEYEAKYTDLKNYHLLMGIYRQALASATGRNKPAGTAHLFAPG